MGEPQDGPIMLLRTLGLFVVTAFAEIIGCYLPYLWMKKGASFLLLLPAAISLDLSGCFPCIPWQRDGFTRPMAAFMFPWPYSGYGRLTESGLTFGILLEWLLCLLVWRSLCLLPRGNFFAQDRPDVIEPCKTVSPSLFFSLPFLKGRIPLSYCFYCVDDSFCV